MTTQKLAEEVVHVTVPIPRSALQIHEQAELASQLTSERTLGMKRRTLLEALPAFEESGGKVARMGKLRLVRVADFVAFLFALGASGRRAPSSASSIESELGLVKPGKKAQLLHVESLAEIIAAAERAHSAPHKIVAARYPGRCYLCADSIRVGSAIAWKPGFPAVHESCHRAALAPNRERAA